MGNFSNLTCIQGSQPQHVLPEGDSKEENQSVDAYQGVCPTKENDSYSNWRRMFEHINTHTAMEKDHGPRYGTTDYRRLPVPYATAVSWERWPPASLRRPVHGEGACPCLWLYAHE